MKSKALALLFLICCMSGCDYLTDPLEISGVWKTDCCDELVTIDLVSTKKFVEIEGKKLPVTVKNFDLDNDIATLINKGENGVTSIWSIRRVFAEDGSFTLNITFDDGEDFDLSFVRNL